MPFVSWIGPNDADWADGSHTKLRAPVPPERWPYCEPGEHDVCCNLHPGPFTDGLYCDCSASAADEEIDNGR